TRWRSRRATAVSRSAARWGRPAYACRWRTRGRDFARRTWSGCSSRSGAAARATGPVPVSGSPSAGPSSRPTAGGSGRRRTPAAAPSASTCPPDAASGVLHTGPLGFRRHHREHVVGRDQLAVLVRDLGVPATLAVTLPLAQRLLLAGDAHLQGVAVVDRFREAQVVEAVVGEHGPERRLDEQAGGEGDDQVAMGHAPV